MGDTHPRARGSLTEKAASYLILHLGGGDLSRFSYTSEPASSTGVSAPPWSAVLNESETGPRPGGCASRSAPAPAQPLSSLF